MEYLLNYLKDSIHDDLIKRCDIAVAIDSKLLAKYLKCSILDLDKCCLCLSDVFSKVSAEYSKDSILDLVQCSLRLSNVFLFQ